MTRQIKKLLVANRGEIAIRILRAAAELKLKTVSLLIATKQMKPIRLAKMMSL